MRVRDETDGCSRREVIRGIGQAAIGASLAVAVGDSAQAQQYPAFRIEDQFAAFMRDLGGSAEDAGARAVHRALRESHTWSWRQESIRRGNLLDYGADAEQQSHCGQPVYF